MDRDLSEVRELVLGAERVVVLTGAGISTDSGIPDFRGPQGVWTKDPEAERTADISYYVSDPEVRRRAWRRRIENTERLAAVPNAGHRALVELERRGTLHALLTQNIDGLHLAAGHDPTLVVELHGTWRDVMCLSCGDRMPAQVALDRVAAGDDDPACLKCGGLLKTATISFGQQLVQDDLRRAFRAAQECDLMLAVGSTLTVTPVADVVPVAKQSGASVVIVNGEATAWDHIADAVVRGPISEILPTIIGAP